MTGDGSGVDVVLTKWSYKGLEDTSDTMEHIILNTTTGITKLKTTRVYTH